MLWFISCSNNSQHYVGIVATSTGVHMLMRAVVVVLHFCDFARSLVAVTDYRFSASLLLLYLPLAMRLIDLKSDLQRINCDELRRTAANCAELFCKLNGWLAGCLIGRQPRWVVSGERCASLRPAAPRYCCTKCMLQVVIYASENNFKLHRKRQTRDNGPH